MKKTQKKPSTATGKSAKPATHKAPLKAAKKAPRKLAKKVAKKAAGKGAATTTKTAAPKKPAAAQKPAVTPAKRATANKKTTAKKVTVAAPSSSSSSSRAGVPEIKKLPWVWKFETGRQCVGLWVDDLVWASNDAGDVFAFTHDGDVHKQMKLPKGSAAAIADEAWKYAGCADGKVYDLTGRSPRAMYDVGKANIGWLEVHGGNLGVADLKGTIAVFDAEGDQRWKQTVKGGGEGWVLRTDSSGLYHGSEVGLRKIAWHGALLWHNADVGDVRFGVLDGDEIVITAGYRKRGAASLYTIDKETGATRLTVALRSNLQGFFHTGAEGCAVLPADDVNDRRIFVGAGGALLVFDGLGKKLWEARFDGDSVCNMMMAPRSSSSSSQGKGQGALFFSTSDGVIARLDISEPAIARALKGSVVKTRVAQRQEMEDVDEEVETTTLVGSGVVVEVVRIAGSLKVRAVSDGYRKDWFCQFPRDLRVEGRRFVVDQLREASQGGFYRALGDIKRLIP